MSDTIRGVKWHLEKNTEAVQPLEGFLSWPWRVGFPGEHQWLIDILREVIRRNKLHPLLQANFETTRPRWFGLWIRSPLNKLQCSILHDLLLAMGDQIHETILNELEQKHGEHPDQFTTSELMLYKEIHGDDHRNLVEFLSALKMAIAHDIPMHVALTPSGHADLGYITIWPHCPRCKADTPSNDWENKEFICPICGNVYYPWATYSQEEDPIRDELSKLLGLDDE